MVEKTAWDNAKKYDPEFKHETFGKRIFTTMQEIKGVEICIEGIDMIGAEDNRRLAIFFTNKNKNKMAVSTWSEVLKENLEAISEFPIIAQILEHTTEKGNYFTLARV